MQVKLILLLTLGLVLMATYSVDASVHIKVEESSSQHSQSTENIHKLTASILAAAVKEAKRRRNNTRAFEEQLLHAHVTIIKQSPGFFAGVFKKPSGSAARKSKAADLLLKATKILAKKQKIPKNQGISSLEDADLGDTAFSRACFPFIACDAKSKYRSYSGICNNLKHPLWGKAETSFVRLIRPDYQNGIDKPRAASDSSELPSARIVSRKATKSTSKKSNKFTHMLMQWGQFLDHDITHTPVVVGKGFAISCCANGGSNPYKKRRHPACFPISIPDNDPFYGPKKIHCMEFVRSLPSVRRDCNLGAREQMNQISAYIDASNVYGSKFKRGDSLRLKTGGLLKYYKEGNSYLLPPSHNEKDCAGESRPCFRAGDARANEQPNLAIMHTLWMREHNRIAKKLASINPQWDDEKLFQEARRIVGAEMQHITYNEFLPIILGRAYMGENDMLPKKHGYSESYDATVDGSIANSFATAAYRFGHSLIRSHLESFDKDGALTKNMPISSVQFAPSFLYEKGTMDEMIRGLTKQKCDHMDNNFPKQLTEMLFARNATFGMDLVALNTQRGRDHGLGSYVRYRKACGFGTAKSFDDLKKDIGKKNVHILKKTYKDVNDIDLFIGGIMEKSVGSALVGKTFRCLMGNQFERLKQGDRYFYENGESKVTRFTKSQLKQIRKVTLSRIICDNADDINKIQPFAFHKTAYWNKKTWCADYDRIKVMNLNKWEEKSPNYCPPNHWNYI